MNKALILEPIINLRKKINAQVKDIKTDFIKSKKIERISIEEKVSLENEGIEIDINDIQIINDGTFTYKSCRVLIYIRDIYKFRPKFHICNCNTFQDMVSKGRKSRYVASSRDDGFFYVNFINNNFGNTEIKSKEEKLDVCLNCLKQLNWNNINSKNSMEAKNIRDNFNLKKFFRMYPKDIIDSEGFLSDRSSPLNTYSPNWNRISNLLRQKANWHCQRCGRDFTHSKHLLDVHHKNGQKNDNRDSNLIVLCRNCHSLEPMHNHLEIPIIDVDDEEVPF